SDSLIRTLHVLTENSAHQRLDEYTIIKRIKKERLDYLEKKNITNACEDMFTLSLSKSNYYINKCSIAFFN
ncbi:hypothetical protein L9F63_008077, partial [Diploptera punctata]